MRLSILSVLWFAIIISQSSFLFGQNNATSKNKNHKKSEIHDSLRIYKQIKKITDKKKQTKQLYDEIFILPDSKKSAVKTKKKKPKYSPNYEGKIIRKIYITTLDPFGYDIYDTSKHARSLFEKGGNFIHIKSKKITIKNHLLIKNGDSLDLYKLKESERIIRTSGYVRDASITVRPTNSIDSVDIYILTQDRWALNFDIAVSTTSYNANVNDNNFLGLGHYASQTVYSSGWKDSIVNFKGQYSVPFIKNTFITLNGFYSTDKYNYNKGFQVSRTFYSPLTQWAGGIELANYSNPALLYHSDTLKKLVTIDFNNYDGWAAHSIGIGKASGKDKDRATRLVYGLRYWQQYYYNTLPLESDKFATFQHHKTVLATVGTSYRGYYKDKFIFRYGTTEDVPIGSVFSITGGIDHRTRGNRLYLGTKAGYARHFMGIGYTALKFEVGSYFLNGKAEQGAARIGVNYFTELIEIYRWKFRQFLSAECVYGFNRDLNELLNINNENGLRGFNSPILAGSNKFVIISQTQLYLPYSFLGFRFAPIIYVGLGTVGNANKSFVHQQVFPVFAIGMQIRNELLVLNTFQFIVGIYPYIPGVDSPSFKINPIQTYDFQFRNYEISRPDVVAYD